MPITFKSKHSPDVLMLHDVGIRMLQAMGLSTTVPGAISGNALHDALANMKQAIAQDVARAHGGDLELSNRPEGGACVTFSL